MKSVSALANALGVCKSTAYRYRNAPDCPGGHAGPWDPIEIAQWATAKRSRNADRSTATQGIGTGHVHDPLRDARTAREELRARRERVELERLEGQKIDRDDIVPMLVSRQRTMKRDLIAMARKLGPQLINKPDGHDIAERIEAEVLRILAIWSRPPTELE